MIGMAERVDFIHYVNLFFFCLSKYFDLEIIHFMHRLFLQMIVRISAMRGNPPTHQPTYTQKPIHENNSQHFIFLKIY